MRRTWAPRIGLKGALVAAAVLALGGAFFVFPRRAAAPRAEAVCPAVTHYSYFSTPPVFDQGYAEAGEVAPDASVKGVLVPHHLLAAKLVAGAFGRIATDRDATVVLVSPNHFSAGRGRIITTAASWRTPYGTLPGDCAAVEALKAAGAASVEEAPFEKEHGVSGIVPFIRKSLPHARVVPVIVRDDASDADLEKFAQAARRIFGPDTLFVASFDFSHELTDTAAKFHDRMSLAVVDAFDDAGARALDIDSMPGLRLSMRLLEQAGAPRFSLVEGSNSSELTHRPDQPDVTSYLAGTFAAGEKTSDDDVTLLAFGDLLLARGVETAVAKHGPDYPFEPIRRLLRGSDLVTANAEGVFADVGEDLKPVKGEDLKFPFEPALLPYLKRLGFTHLGEANNHASDFGRPALETSRAAMGAAGLATFGDPSNAEALTSMTEVRGRKIAQIGYSQFGGKPDATLAAIAEAKKAGAFVVVYAHWGVEYEPKPTQLQVSLAHRFVEAGAVIGSHPHVIQPIEVYKGKAIFYSLGNFIFDQPSAGPTGQGLAVGMADGAEGTTFYLMPLEIRGAQASLMPYEKRSTLIRQLGVPTGVFTLKPSP